MDAPCLVQCLSLVFGVGRRGPRCIAPRAVLFGGGAFFSCSLGSHARIFPQVSLSHRLSFLLILSLSVCMRACVYVRVYVRVCVCVCRPNRNMQCMRYLDRPPQFCIVWYDKGRNAVRFCPGLFSGDRPTLCRVQQGRQKYSFSRDFLVFFVWRLWVLLLFCFEFAFCVPFFPRKKKLFFLLTLSFWGRFFAISCGRIFVAVRFPSTLALLPLLFLSSSSSLGLARVFFLLLLLILPPGDQRRRIAPLRFTLLASFCLPGPASSCFFLSFLCFFFLFFFSLPPFPSSFLAWSSI